MQPGPGGYVREKVSLTKPGLSHPCFIKILEFGIHRLKFVSIYSCLFLDYSAHTKIYWGKQSINQ